MVVLTKEKKNEYKDFRKTLEYLRVDENTYSQIVEGGKTLISQLADGVETTNNKLCARFPNFGQILNAPTQRYITQCDYMYRLLENYFDEELDNIEYFGNDRRTLLMALRHDLCDRKEA